MYFVLCHFLFCFDSLALELDLLVVHDRLEAIPQHLCLEGHVCWLDVSQGSHQRSMLDEKPRSASGSLANRVEQALLVLDGILQRLKDRLRIAIVSGSRSLTRSHTRKLFAKIAAD